MALYQITAPHFCAGITTHKDRVDNGAPIVRYMDGWPLSRVEEYCRKKDWQLERYRLGWTPQVQQQPEASE